MLNTTFSRKDNNDCGDSFVAPNELAGRIRAGNSIFDTGYEYRTQAVYGNEIWAKLSKGKLGADRFSGRSVLELCAGNGFLTYHLLSQVKPKRLVVNDISSTELDANKALVSELVSNVEVEWLNCDMHELDVTQKFDIVIGNSFLHHFYDVPTALKKIRSVLSDDGVFVTLHEPTPLATFVESGKGYLVPFAAIAPEFMNNLVRDRYVGRGSATDLWLFKPKDLSRLGKEAGFSRVVTKPLGLIRPLVVRNYDIHLSADTPMLSQEMELMLRRAISMDQMFARVLPRCFFGSVSGFFFR